MKKIILVFFVLFFASFVSATDKYWVGGTAVWNTTAGTKWSLTSGGAGGADIPSSSDNVFFDANSGNVTVTITSDSNSANLNFSGFIGTLTGTQSPNIFGNLILSSNMTLSITASINLLGSGDINITTNGKQIPVAVTLNNSLGNFHLQDDLNLGSTRALILTAGSFDANNHNLDIGAFNNGVAAGTVTMGSGTWTLLITLNGNSAWSINSGTTVVAGTSTIRFYNNVNTSNINFTSSGKTYNNIWISNPVGGTTTLSNSNDSFNNFKIDANSVVGFWGGKTQTVNSFTAVGSSTQLITLKRSFGGGAFVLSSSSGRFFGDYLTISNSNAIGGAKWYAGLNSIDGGNNSGWIFGKMSADANIWKIDSYDFNASLPSFSYFRDKNLTITFWTKDKGQEDQNFNLWYGVTQGAKTNLIVGDLNLSSNNGLCDSNNSATGMVCNWDWNISGISDGNYWLTMDINNGVDVNSMSSVKSFMLDNTIPSSNSISVSSFSGIGRYTFVNPVPLILSSSDSVSGVSQMKFSCDNTTFGSYVSYTTSYSSFNVRSGEGCTDSDGNKTVYVIFKDAAGNESSSVNSGTGGNSFYLDTLVPTFTSILVSSFSGQTGYTNVEKSPFSLTASDTGAGMFDMNFSCDNSIFSSTIAYAATYSDFNIASGAGCSNADGNKIVYSRIRDRAYNVGTASTSSFVLDRLKPTTIWDGNISWQNFDANVALSIVDATSGLQLIQYKKDSNALGGVALGALTNYDVNRVLFQTDGNYAIDFNSMDRAGNLSDVNRQFVLIDKNVPTINNVVPVTSSNVNIKTVSFDLNEAGFSGLNTSEIKIKINGVYSSSFVFGTACVSSDGNYNCSFNEAGIVDGANTIIIDANDNAGNHAQATTAFTYNVSLDVLVVVPNVSLYWGKNNNNIDSNHWIDANFTDSIANASPFKASFWYSAVAGAKQNLILKDVNLLDPVFCVAGDSNTQITRFCRIGWNVSSVSDGNYVIDVNATDGLVQSIDSSDRFFQIDNIVPTLSNPNPASNVTSDVETNPYLSLTASDSVGIKQCHLKVYKNGALFSDSNVSPTTANVCGTNVSLTTSGDYGFISVVAYDFALNPSALNSTANWVYQVGGGSGGQQGGGGGGGTGSGTGDVNAFCIQTQQCFTGLVCLNNKCIVPIESFGLDDLSVSPSVITSDPFQDVLPNSRIVLQDIVLQNAGDSKIDLNAGFFCSQEQNCASSWCSILGESLFSLQPNGVAVLKTSCIIPSDALVGSEYFTQLVFNSVLGSKGVSVTIPIRYSALSSFLPFGLVSDWLGSFLNSGLPCLGFQKNCILSFGDTAPSGIERVPVWFWLLLVVIGVNWVLKFKNPFALGFLLVFVLIVIIFLFSGGFK